MSLMDIDEADNAQVEHTSDGSDSVLNVNNSPTYIPVSKPGAQKLKPTPSPTASPQQSKFQGPLNPVSHRTRQRVIHKSKRRVSFQEDPVDEIRQIDKRSTVSSPLKKKGKKDLYSMAGPSASIKAPRLAAALQQEAKKAPQVLAYKTAFKGVFGLNHVPTRYPGVANKRAAVRAQEELEDRMLGSAPRRKTNKLSLTVEFCDMHSKVEFTILRSQIPTAMRDIIERQEMERDGPTGDPPVVQLDWATPAAIWMYIMYLSSGYVQESIAGWSDIVQIYPELAQDSYLNALLASLAMARDINDKSFETVVVEELTRIVKLGMGPVEQDDPAKSVTPPHHRTKPTGKTGKALPKPMKRTAKVVNLIPDSADDMTEADDI